MLILLVIGNLLVGIACIANNYYNANGSVSNKPSNWASMASLHEDRATVFQGVLHFLFSLVLIAGIVIFRKFIREKMIEIDEINITPADFTVWVKGIPYNTDFEDLKKYMQTNSYPENLASEVVAISPAYMISEYVEKVREKKQLLFELNYVKEYKQQYGKVPIKKIMCCSKEYPTEDQLNFKINQLNEWQKEFENKSNLEFNQGNSAFITYRKQTDCKETIDYWHESSLEKISQICLLCLHRYAYSERTYKGNMISVEQAPEPSDIIWENLNVSFLVKFYRRCQTAVVTTILIVISFFIVFGIKEYEFNQYQDYTDSGKKISNSENIKIKAISVLLSFTIQILNVVISVCVRLFSGYEKHATWTHYNISVFHKLVISTTLNTVLVLFLVNSYTIQTDRFDPTDVNTHHWFTEDYGISTDLYSLLLIDAFVTPVILVFSPMYLFKLWTRSKIRKGQKIVTQHEANEIWTNPEIDLSQRSARYVKTMLVVLVFAPIFPLGFPMGLLSVLIQYWADKILLLRRYSRSKTFGKGLTLSVLQWFPVAVLCYTVFFI